MVGTALRLPGVVLVDARGADDGEATQHVARAVQWSATIERRRMTPVIARESPHSHRDIYGVSIQRHERAQRVTHTLEALDEGSGTEVRAEKDAVEWLRGTFH